MADRNHTETGSQQFDITSKTTTIGYNADVRRDDTIDASIEAFSQPPKDEKALREAEAKAIRETRRDTTQEEKLPTDRHDPYFENP